jgi:hypothetical protein
MVNMADQSVPDISRESLQQVDPVDHRYNSVFLAELLKVLMSYGTTSDRGWSQEALDFSAIPTSNSLEPFINVSVFQ